MPCTLKTETGGQQNINGGRRRMIYNEINFEASPFQYHLKYLSRITIVRGDNATGKTHLFTLLEDLKLTETYQKIQLFNYKSEKFHESLADCRGNFIVVDNADILLNEEDRRFINFEKSNQYMLFLRNCDGINLLRDSFAVLQEDEGKISLKREW